MISNGVMTLFGVILLKSVAVGANYVKSAEMRPMLSATQM